jgi:SAM-dependent methyltransferase
MSWGWPHRVRPLGRAAVMRNRKGSARFEYRVGRPEDYVFTADVYAYREREHPGRHLGWWRFALPEGRGVAELRLDFAPIRRESVTLSAGGRPVACVDAWWNPEFAFDPLGDVELVFRDPQGNIRSVRPVLLKYVDRDVLRAFYARQYAVQGYAPPADAPFLHELHAYKLRVLRRLFERHIPAGGRALDVGCGRSLFADIGVPFPFTVVAGDLDFQSVRDRAGEVPHQQWGVFDASALPFPDATFDALFAGEVIEHVPDARVALREWGRVLKPGGVAIVTTPNRQRLVARANRMEVPYSRDHLSELSYAELSGPLLRETGFTFVDQACLYLEIWLRGLLGHRVRVDDYLAMEGNRRGYVWLMRALMPTGRWLPSLSLDMIVVARKRETSDN